MEKVTIDLKIFIVEALATNKKIEKSLTTYYKINKFKAYELAKKSKLYNHPMIIDGSIYREVQSKRALGLVLLSEVDEEVSKLIEKLYKKGWPILYKYINRLAKNNDVFDMNYIFENIMKPKGHQMTDDEANALVAFGYCFAINSGIEIIKNEALDIVEKTLYTRLNFYEDNSNYRYSFETIDKELYKKAKGLLQRIELKYGYEYFTNIDNLLRFTEQTDPIYSEARIMASRLSFIFDDETCMAANMLDINISEKLKLEVLVVFCMTNKTANAVEATQFLINGILFKKLIKGYKEVKKYYFENNQETLFLELSKYEIAEQKATAEKERIQKLYEEVKLENTRLKKEYKTSLESEITLLKQELANMKQKELEQKALTREVANLRSALHQSEDESIIHSSVDLEKVNSLKGIIIGGHQNWHQLIKKRVDFDCVLEANTHLLEHIEEYDVVLFKTSYLDHPTYLKVIEKVRRSTPIFGYLQHSNIDLCLEEIEKIIDDK